MILSRKPLPLTTVELQKAGSRLLKLAPKKVLDIAERLYQQGFVSYPRTETDQYDPQFNFMQLIEKQAADTAWGGFARSLQQGGFSTPRKGKNNDQAHPPIHPTAHAGGLSGDEKKVYEFITRRFLACCSKDAEGWQTTVDVVFVGEEFTATGLIVTQRNYLDVYPYDKWVDNDLPEFRQGEEFVPSICELRQGETTKPNLLTEADLVTLMDKNGIGTDATIAQHIQTIIDREYVIERMEGSTKYLIPSTLGIGLVEGYDQIALERSLSKPQLRRETERNMVQICQRTKTKNDMLTETIDQYKTMFMMTRAEFAKIVDSVRMYWDGQANIAAGPGVGGGGGSGGGGGGGGGTGGGGAGGGRGRGRRRGASGGGQGGDNNDDSGNGGTRKRARATSTTKTRGTTSTRGRGRTKTPSAAVPPPPPPRATVTEAPRTTTNNSYTTATTMTTAPTYSMPPRTNSAPAQAQRGTENSVLCYCNKPVTELRVTKESVNKGRLFWRCAQPAQCSFFEWADGAASGSSGGGTSTTTAASATTIPAKRTYSSVSVVFPLTPMMSVTSAIKQDIGRVVGPPFFFVSHNSPDQNAVLQIVQVPMILPSDHARSVLQLTTRQQRNRQLRAIPVIKLVILVLVEFVLSKLYDLDKGKYKGKYKGQRKTKILICAKYKRQKRQREITP
ncbi:hypothetical protein AX16_006988 [Volvariella volvacea WC 439]|nr:hypothetical protein AX16_006988 [Volvariella volvacea WC 439]